MSAPVPPHRSYITVELPFVVSPSPLQEADISDIVKYAPPSFLVPCLHDAAPVTKFSFGDPLSSIRSQPRLHHHAPPPQPPALPSSASTSKKKRHRRSGGRGSKSADPLPRAQDEGDEGPGSGYRTSSSSDADGEKDDDDAEATSSDDSAPSDAGDADDGERPSTKRPRLRLLVGDAACYCPQPIFSGWRSTAWETQDEQQKGRVNIFPSLEPQLLLQGYYRNDLLLRMGRRRRIRRYRDATTGEVLREELVDSMEPNAEGHPIPSPPLEATVVGVVSREVEIARPADFTFSLFSSDQAMKMPALCDGGLFPPSHYLNERAQYEVPYEPGRLANTSLPDHRSSNTTRTSATAAASTTPPSDATDISGSGRAMTQWEMETLPTITISPDDSAQPPVQLEAHETFLRSLGSSLDGSAATDPPEVRVVARLLAARPAWITRDLLNAVLQSGFCPRLHHNKQVVNCLTYIISNGPFNRLRLRLGYNPYAAAQSAVYQRIAVRLHRRSDIGVRLRDLSRSPHIESVVRILLERDRRRRLAYQAIPGNECRATLLELLCRTVRVGSLSLPFQLADAMDDAGIQEIVANIAAVTTPMELSRRRLREGWMSGASYTRAMSRYTAALDLLLTEEVEPLLRKLQGKETGVVEKGEGLGDAGSSGPVHEALHSGDDSHNTSGGSSAASFGSSSVQSGDLSELDNESD